MRSSKSRNRNKNNNRRPSGNIINRVFDSSGPEGKVRGTPQQIIDKYNQLARDATLAGDRVAVENFQQHAEHYTRLLAEAQREQAERQAQQEAQQAQANEARRERQEAQAREQAANAEEGSAESGSNATDAAVSDGESQPADVQEERPARKPRNRRPRSDRAPREDRKTKDEGVQPETEEAQAPAEPEEMTPPAAE